MGSESKSVIVEVLLYSKLTFMKSYIDTCKTQSKLGS